MSLQFLKSNLSSLICHLFLFVSFQNSAAGDKVKIHEFQGSDNPEDFATAAAAAVRRKRHRQIMPLPPEEFCEKMLGQLQQ